MQFSALLVQATEPEFCSGVFSGGFCKEQQIALEAGGQSHSQSRQGRKPDVRHRGNSRIQSAQLIRISGISVNLLKGGPPRDFRKRAERTARLI